MDFAKLWENALPIVEEEVSAGSFRTFIEPLKPLQIAENMAYFLTTNEINRICLNERYKTILEQALAQAGSAGLCAEFLLPGEELPSEKAKGNPCVNGRYTFDSFVIGNSNRFASAASMAVAKNPGRSYNPLFIYGGVGLGKTHLMNAIGNEILNNAPETNILYATCEKFTNDLIACMVPNKGDRSTKNEQFRTRYRNVDVLMIDDIQFLHNKEGIQEEFFHTFNTLYENNKQIVLTSDRPPKEIPTLEERLRSRFEWGLIADISSPDYETRVAILMKKAETEHLNVPLDVLEYIAQRGQSNIRELEGSLTRVIAYGELIGKKIDIGVAVTALKDYFPQDKGRKISMGLIQEVICDYYDISKEDLLSKRRTQNIAFPRQVAMYLCRELTEASLPAIGSEFGGKDHTTVMHAYDKIFHAAQADEAFKAVLNDLMKRIKE